MPWIQSYWLTGPSLDSINCSHLKSKEQFKELKGRTGIGGWHEKKKFKIVMEELAIMNSLLIPLWQMLVIIPWVRLIPTPLLRITNPALLWYFKDRFLCGKDFGWIANCGPFYIRNRVHHSSVFSAPVRRVRTIWNLHVHKRARAGGGRRGPSSLHSALASDSCVKPVFSIIRQKWIYVDL